MSLFTIKIYINIVVVYQQFLFYNKSVQYNALLIQYNKSLIKNYVI